MRLFGCYKKYIHDREWFQGCCFTQINCCHGSGSISDGIPVACRDVMPSTSNKSREKRCYQCKGSYSIQSIETAFET